MSVPVMKLPLKMQARIALVPLSGAHVRVKWTMVKMRGPAPGLIKRPPDNVWAVIQAPPLLIPTFKWTFDRCRWQNCYDTVHRLGSPDVVVPRQQDNESCRRMSRHTWSIQQRWRRGHQLRLQRISQSALANRISIRKQFAISRISVEDANYKLFPQ